MVYRTDIQRDTGTVKTNWPFKLVVNYYKTHNIWTLTVDCDEHNHPYIVTLDGHAYVMRLTKDEFVWWKNCQSIMSNNVYTFDNKGAKSIECV